MNEQDIHEAEWREIERENRARDARLAAYRGEELQRVLEASRRVRTLDEGLFVALRKAGAL